LALARRDRASRLGAPLLLLLFSILLMSISLGKLTLSTNMLDMFKSDKLGLAFTLPVAIILLVVALVALRLRSSIGTQCISVVASRISPYSRLFSDTSYLAKLVASMSTEYGEVRVSGPSENGFTICVRKGDNKLLEDVIELINRNTSVLFAYKEEEDPKAMS
jgi:hypothetical protein